MTGQLEALLGERIAPGWHVRNQAPVTLSESEPEPDLTVVRGSRGDYRTRHPGAQDVALVIEVPDTTLATDRLKARTYAAAGIAEYWIVNLADRCVEVHRNPKVGEASYGTRETIRESQALSVVGGADSSLPIPVIDILP